MSDASIKVGRDLSDDIIQRKLEESANIPSVVQSSQKQSVPNTRLHVDGLKGALDGIVKDVVEILGFAGAMVAIYDDVEDALTVKSYFFDPDVIAPGRVQSLEEQASKLTRRKISLIESGIATVHVHRSKESANLGVQAAISGQNIKSNDLFDLFTPIIPRALSWFVQKIQRECNIQEVVTIPFFIESQEKDDERTERKTHGEFVGNLFAAKCGEITTTGIKELSTFARYMASIILSERRRTQIEIIEKLILDIQKNLRDEEQVLKRIVEGVVCDLRYAGAMVAVYEPEEDRLPVKAIYVDPNIAKLESINKWEKAASKLLGKSISLTNPEFARVFPHDEEYKANLSSKAVAAGEPVISSELFDLFTPIIPEITRGFIRKIQDGMNVNYVIAVPFFLETAQENGSTTRELVGNLFAATRSYEINAWELKVLQAFGQQAAAGLQNVRLYRKTEKLLTEKEYLLQEKEKLLSETEILYRKAEDRRKAGEIFGKMAFSASASVHALRGHMGVIKGNLQLVTMLNQLNDETKEKVLKNQIPRTMERLKEMQQLIESLHEPWRPINDTVVDVNACIKRAVDKVFPGDDNPWITFSLSDQPLEIKTTPEMLTEAFKVLVKNAKEAMQSQDDDKKALFIQSQLQENQVIVVIQDSGTGIGPEYLEKIFEMRFTTKSSGLGFGLFWTKDYVSGLGGKIDVTSSLGQGTIFTISLPVHTPSG